MVGSRTVGIGACALVVGVASLAINTTTAELNTVGRNINPFVTKINMYGDEYSAPDATRTSPIIMVALIHDDARMYFFNRREL